MQFDAMKEALLKKKSDLQHGFKISIDLQPNDAKEEESEKKLGVAPTVKDAESPKEPKLMANEESGEGEPEGSPGEESSEGPMEEAQELKAGDAIPGMPELPNGREPISLHEKAHAGMIKKLEAKQKK